MNDQKVSRRRLWANIAFICTGFVLILLPDWALQLRAQISVANDDVAYTAAGQFVFIDVLKNDGNLFTKSPKITDVDKPFHGTAEIDGELLKYTPAPDFSGEDTFIYDMEIIAVNPKTGLETLIKDQAKVDIKVNPLAKDDTVSTLINTPVKIQVLSNDVGTQIRIEDVDPPKNGTSAKEGNLIIYTPDSGFFGTDNFTYMIEDTAGLDDTAQVMVTVNIPPSADAGPDQIIKDIDNNGFETVTLDGTNSSDLDGSIVSYQWFEKGQEIASDPSPTVDLEVGVHNITLRVTDNDGLTDEDEVIITIVWESIVPLVTETGFISQSVDGLGTNNPNGGFIQVQKPAGATVRKAFMAAASTGFSGRALADGDVSIDGTPVVWNVIASIPSTINSFNSFADVTALVKPKIDMAPPGLVDFLITEVETFEIDGEILAVIFDDPNQTTSNTIVLLFGAQDVSRDTFSIKLAEPLDLSDPNLVLNLSLGISYGFQPSPQDSQVDVNGLRLTSSAGGQDDGEDAIDPLVNNDGALLTVGGLGDSNSNPLDPFARGDQPTCPRCDDELYDLLPFVNDGDTSIVIDSINPSNDDNIFFASLFLASTTAIVGEGILLSPVSVTKTVSNSHTVIAEIQDDNGNPVEGREVTFEIISGPNGGLLDTDTTNADGEAAFTYIGDGGVGTDVVVASFVDAQGNLQESNPVNVQWGFSEDKIIIRPPL